MKTTRNLTSCVKALVGAASVALVLPVAALEKPAEKAGAQEAPKEKAGEAAAADEKAPKPAEKVAMLGVGGNQASETLSLHLGLAEGNGLTVYHVVPGSAAAKAGLEAHDIITEVGDKKIGSQDDLRAAVLAHKPGDEVTVKLIHKGKAEEKKIVLGERVVAPRDGLMDMPRLGRVGGEDLMRMLQGMGGNIPEADRKRMEEQMKKHFDQLQKQLQNGGMPLDMDDLMGAAPKGKKGGIHMLGGTSVSIQDDKGSVTMKTVNGKKEVIVRDKAGKVVFEGPYETEQDKAAVPDDISERIKRVDVNFKGNGMRLQIGPGGIMPPQPADEDEAAE
ncbi:hypothetical protein NT6N_01470 [Oceaniferula spumae]|uniref:PDZ domain-containing protein n=1 Tax=Oceaniferula spumae TaxID=2979115 RepID=A0AAT9FGK9_9BACT